MKRTKSILCIVLALVMVAMCASCGNGSGTTGSTAGTSTPGSTAGSTAATGGDVIVFKLGHTVDTNHSWQKGAEKFAELLEEKSGGTMKVEIFPNASLGGDRDLVEGMQMGTVDMALIAGVVGNFYEPILLLELPYIFNDQEHLRKVIYGEVGEQIKTEMKEEINIVSLEFWERTPRETTSNKAINTPDDLKGLKIRVPEIPAMVDAWKAMGANPTPMAFSEVYTALQQGTIDAQENPLANIVSANIHEVQSHINMTNHVYGYVMHLMSESAYEKLTDEQRAIVVEAAAEARDYQNSLILDEEAALRVMLEEKGIIFVDVDITPFQELAKTIHSSYAAQYGQDKYDKIIAAGQ